MHSEERRKALEQSWAITCRHLKAAKESLIGRQNIDPEAFNEYQGWLDHNELELALDELEALSETINPDSRFWQNMLQAAQNMGLQKHAARYKGRLTT